MTETIRDYIQILRADRVKRRYALAILFFLSVLVALGVTWQMRITGITLTGDAYCGYTEHEHSEDCYAETLVCGLEESEEHTHTDACYEKALVCGLEEHVHTLACYSDSSADVETEKDWEATLPELVGIWREDVVEIADSQVGYTESERNYIVDNNGERKGYTRYGAWYGSEYGDWSAMFASWCVHYAGIDSDAMPYASGCENWIVRLEKNGQYTDDAASALVPGNLIFFDQDGDGQADRVGILTQAENTELTVIAGDVDEAVLELTCDLADETILGAGLLPENGGYAAALASDEVSGLNISSYIETAELQYRTKSTEAWQPVTAGTEIPGNAELYLRVEKSDIPLSLIRDSDYTIYYEVPAFMREIKADGVYKVEDENAGTIQVVGKYVVVTFDQDWLDSNLEEASNAVLKDSYLTITSQIDYQSVQNAETEVWMTGGVTINAKFTPDIIAKSGDVDIQKSVASKVIDAGENGVFLAYTITVTAGQDGMPGVVVKDTLTNNSYIDGYAGIPSGGGTLSGEADGQNPVETISAGKTHGSIALNGDLGFAWTIGDMAANESRTLNYYVKMKDDYLTVKSVSITSNKATVYSKNGEIERGSDTADFTATASASLSKWATSVAADTESGGYIITYQLLVKSGANNQYTLRDVQLKDVVGYSVNGTTGADYTQFRLVDNSFAYYKGEYNGGTPKNRIASDDAKALFTLKESGSENGLFDMTVAELAPGESYTIVYQLKVSEQLAAEMGSGQGKVTNSVASYLSDGVTNVGNASAEQTLSGNKWTRKLAGTAAGQSKTIETGQGDSYYDLTGGSAKESENPGSFTVPENGVEFHVLVNENGKWGVSGAHFADDLQSTAVQYSGWMRISVHEGVTNSSQTDAQALAAVENSTELKTIWVKVDGLHTFNFTPESLGETAQDHHAYLLDYYVVPADQTQAVVVENTFALSGDVVGAGGGTYTLARTTASATATVVGTSTLNAEKSAWYYQANAKDPDGNTVTNGLLYWVIEVKTDGLANAVLPYNTSIIDRPERLDNGYKDASGATSYSRHHVRGMWVYTGQAGIDFSDSKFSSLDDLGLNEVGSVWAAETIAKAEGDFSYNISYDEAGLNGRWGKITVANQNGYQIGEGNSLYVVVASEPGEKDPTVGKRSMGKYSNRLRIETNGQGEVLKNTVEQTVYGSENVLKEAGMVFTYNEKANTYKQVKAFAESTSESVWKSRIATSAIDKSGTYLTWNIKVNYAGLLSGNYVFEDVIPDGLEIAYARIKWFGADQTNPRPTSTRLSDTICPDSEWDEYSVTYRTDGDAAQVTSYYYVNKDDPQLIRWGISNLKGASSETFDTYAVDFQVVCRVTDQSVLMGGAERAFTNQVTLYEGDGETSKGSDGSTITLQETPVTKSSVMGDGAEIAYTIQVNELGEDLLEGSDKVTLVDVMSSYLRLTGTVTVTDRNTGQALDSSEYSYNVETDDNTNESILRVTLPDNLALSVTYTAVVQAPPGETVTSIVNVAYWEGYDVKPGGRSTIQNYKYSVGGGGSLADSPTIKIHKVDGENYNLGVDNVQFSLETIGTFENSGSGWDASESGKRIQGVTSDGGWLTFSTGTETALRYNTLYALVEDNTPEEYAKSSRVRYLIVVKEEDGWRPEISEKTLTDLKIKGSAYDPKEKIDMADVIVEYQSNELDVTVPNYKKVQQFTLQKVDATNNKTYLPGAEFTLYRNDEKINTFVTGEDGKVTITLPENEGGAYTYILKETKAPDGYYPSDEVWTLTIDLEGRLSVTDSSGGAVSPVGGVYVVENTPGYELPETGGFGALPFIIIGPLLMAGAVMYGFTRRGTERGRRA